MRNKFFLLSLAICCSISACSNIPNEVTDEDLSSDNVVESRKYETIKTENGNMYLDFTIDNCVTDSGSNPYNVKQTIAGSDLVVMSEVENYVSTMYMSELSPGYPSTYYVPLAISVSDVIKGDNSRKESEMIIGNNGGYLSVDTFSEHIDTDVDVSLYSDISEVRISYGEVLPETGDKYIFCLNMISDEYLDSVGVDDPTYEYIVKAKYLVSDGMVYLNGNVISDEEAFMDNINDETWLSTIEKPDWAVSITYVPYGASVDLESSYGSEDTYRMVYTTAATGEKPYGVGYHIWQMTNSGIASNVEDYVYMSSELDSYTYEEISGVKIKVITIPGERSCACVYFSLPGIDFLIEGVYVDGTSELVNIATSLIYEYQLAE